MFKHWLLFLCLCPLFLCAQNTQEGTLLPTKEFFQEGMQKTDGVLPVYLYNGKAYLEFPRTVWGRELLITAQIDRGFDLVNRPANSIGVVRVQVKGDKQVILEQPSYADRMPEVFQEATIQPQDHTYPVEAVSPEGGLIIDVTDLLSTGDEWFTYNYQSIRTLDTQHVTITGASAFDEGVSFHIQRRHGYTPERANVSSAITMLPEGSMPLWLSCTIRLLPAEDMPVRLSAKDDGFQSITFGDHAQDPYKKLTDSLLIRWRMDVPPADKQAYAKGKAVRPTHPVTLCVDRYFPEQFRPAIQAAVTAWNRAFLDAGFQDALCIKELKADDLTPTCQALISYDLGTASVERSFVHHPRTGEILSCRINVGHGCIADKPNDYWWQEDINLEDSSIANELLTGELICAIGDILGLHSSSPNPLFLKDASTISNAQKLAIATGYRIFPDARDCYADRDQLRQWRKQHVPNIESSTDPVEPYAKKLTHLQKQFRKLDKMPANEARQLYKNGLKLYGNYLKEIALFIGSNQPENIQQEAMQLLAEQFFNGSSRFDNRSIQANTTENRQTSLSATGKDIFDHLLSQQTIATLQRAEWYAGPKDKGLTAKRFFQSLYDSLFNGFSPESHYTYEQLDLMLLCVEAWKHALEADKESSNMTGKVRLKTEWAYVQEQLKELSNSHTDESLRSLFAWMANR